MSDNLIFDEWYGYVSPAQRRCYRKHNVAPADHNFIIEILGYEESDRDAIICHVLRNLRNGQYVLPLGSTR